MKSITVLLSLSVLTTLTSAQTTTPGPFHDCSSQTFYSGSLACNNVLTTCCGATETCCGRGCCGFDAVCVFPGTADAACCPLGTAGNCGYDPYPSTGGDDDSCAPKSTFNIPCSGFGSSWYCNSGCTCNVSVDGGCNCFGGSGCDDDDSSSSSSSSVVPTVESSTVAAASLASSTTDAVEASDQSGGATSTAETGPESSSIGETPVTGSQTTAAGGVETSTQSVAGGGNSGSVTGGTSITRSVATTRTGSISGSSSAGAAPQSTTSAGHAGSVKVDGMGVVVLGLLGWIAAL